MCLYSDLAEIILILYFYIIVKVLGIYFFPLN